jgi:hypothetical protein
MNSVFGMDGFGIGFDGPKPFLVRANLRTYTTEELTSTRKLDGDEASFLDWQFADNIHIDDLRLEPIITSILQARVDEIIACPRSKVALGTIFLLGSTLEGILLGIAPNRRTAFMSSPKAPKKLGSPIDLAVWNLAQLIDTAAELKIPDVDVQRFSHALRSFRNYVHLYRQMAESFNPDQHTVDICWQVFKAVFAQLKRSASA